MSRRPRKAVLRPLDVSIRGRVRYNYEEEKLLPQRGGPPLSPFGVRGEKGANWRLFKTVATLRVGGCFFQRRASRLGSVGPWDSAGNALRGVPPQWVRRRPAEQPTPRSAFPTEKLGNLALKRVVEFFQLLMPWLLIFCLRDPADCVLSAISRGSWEPLEGEYSFERGQNATFGAIWTQI